MLEMQRVSQECLFGRLPSCGIQLEHLSASRAHAQLSTDGAGNLFLTDLGSGEAVEGLEGGGRELGRVGLAGWAGYAVSPLQRCAQQEAVHTLPPPTCLFPACPSHPAAPGLLPHPACPAPPAAHGTNVDGAWIKAKVPKQLQAGSVLKFGASAREYRVVKLPQPAARR